MNNIKTCDYCGEEFHAKRSDAKFCSNSCKQQSYLNRMNQPESKEKEHYKKPDEPIRKPPQPQHQSQPPVNTEHNNQRRANSGFSQQFYDSVTKNFSAQSFIDENRKRMALEEVVRKLKEWINEMLSFSKKDSMPRDDVKNLVRDIELFQKSQHAKYIQGYKYNYFIDDELKNKLKKAILKLEYKEQELLRFEMADSYIEKMMDVLLELD